MLQRRLNLNRDDFRNSIYDVAECLTNHPLSDSGKKLVLHYFNEAKYPTSFEKALHAIEKYFPESMPEQSEMSKMMIRLMDKMKEEADRWDSGLS